MMYVWIAYITVLCSCFLHSDICTWLSSILIWICPCNWLRCLHCVEHSVLHLVVLVKYVVTSWSTQHSVPSRYKTFLYVTISKPATGPGPMQYLSSVTRGLLPWSLSNWSIEPISLVPRPVISVALPVCGVMHRHRDNFIFYYAGLTFKQIVRKK